MCIRDSVWYGLDVHLYSNHLEQARTQLERQPRIFPSLKIRPGVTSLFDYRIEDIDLVDYDPHPPISAEVAV